MDTETQPHRPKRRRRGKKRKPSVCVREGCDRGRGREHPACSYLCAVVAQELERAQRLCEAVPDTEHWLAVVSLNDALTEYWTSDKRVYLAAREVGFSDDEWLSLKHPQASRRSPFPRPSTTDTATGA